MAALKVFIGWDSKEIDAYEVARHSVLRHSSVELEIVPLNVHHLRKQGIYYRNLDPLASTEFSYTRFLAPYLSGFEGKIVFFDCDFLWCGDIGQLISQATGDFAVWCVKHEYEPKESTKMNGAIQSAYPRKNWSSLMVFNANHKSTRNLTIKSVSESTPAYLHRMQWANDSEIGELDFTWNWLEGVYPKPKSGTPEAIHFTRGGPWFKQWKEVDYAELWFAELDNSRK
jgi:lipopolysaccharide biosynthesis glycosyltransferase